MRQTCPSSHATLCQAVGSKKSSPEDAAMASVIRSSSNHANDRETTEAIARETETDVEVVQEIYQQELSVLANDAKITQYLGVLASRRVRLLLRRH
jgi:hypothetical protein